MDFDGFDSVELIMHLEDRLGFSIPDRDADRLHNPRDVVEYLSQRLGLIVPPDRPRCRSAEAFREGRQRIARAFGLAVASIRPATPVTDLLPDESNATDRWAAWSQLSRVLGVPLPNLRHPARYHAGAVVVCLAVFACFVWQGTLHPPGTAWNDAVFVVVAASVSFAVPFVLLRVTRRRLATVVPIGFQTVGRVVSGLTLTTIPEGPSSPAGWTRHELWELVRDLTAKSAHCPPSRVRPDIRWTSL